MATEWQYRLKGERVGADEMRDRPDVRVTALTADLHEAGIIEAFSAETDFDQWAESRGTDETVKRVRQMIAEADEEKLHPREQVEARYKRQAERVRRDLIELATKERMRFDPRGEASERPDAEQLLRRAKERRPGEQQIFDSGILFEHADYGGRWLPIVYTLPDFTWVNFNDVCSSFVMWGAGVLFEHTWYSGRQFWMFGGGGMPWIGTAFNDIASSVILVG
jgi:Beta/Gamma crystallin